MDKLNIVKIGGSVAEDDKALSLFLDDFSRLEGAKILVHGGASKATALSKQLGIEVKIKDGRRITDADSLDVAVMVYAGLINKNLVAKLQARGCNAVGLSGADLNVIPAQKRIHSDIDYGFVGDIDTKDINSYMLRRLMDESVVPVFCAVTHDTQGQLLNTNADTIAASLAIVLSTVYKVSLTFCMDIPGVLEDVEDPGSLLESLDIRSYQKFKRSRAISSGMIPKLHNGFEALEKGTDKVVIKHSKNLLTETGTVLSL